MLSSLKNIKCSNCNHTDLTVLKSINSRNEQILTSDAKVISEAEAIRTLCLRCACIEVHFFPEKRLNDFYHKEYSLSEKVQNHFIVVNNQVFNKHEYILNNLFSNFSIFQQKQGNMLEIACGKGELIKNFSEHFPGWNCYGIDPSMDSIQNIELNTNIIFINDFFKASYFSDVKFDVIIAHGLLNRSPVLPELFKIRECSDIGTLLSLEFMVLEESECTPYIWDHSFMYKKSVMDDYLKVVGYEIIYKRNLASSYHYICRCVSVPGSKNSTTFSEDIIRSTGDIYSFHQKWWDGILSGFREELEKVNGGNLALFGAGMYSAILLMNSGRFNDVIFIIDEIKKGENYLNKEVINLETAASNDKLHVLLCTRPAYKYAIMEKLKDFHIPFTSLM